MRDGAHHPVWRRVGHELRLRPGCVYAIFISLRDAPAWPGSRTPENLSGLLQWRPRTIRRVLTAFEREGITVAGMVTGEWAEARHEKSDTKNTENTEIRHENSSALRQRGRPKSLKPLSNAERCKRYRDTKNRISVSRPGYEEEEYYTKKKTLLVEGRLGAAPARTHRCQHRRNWPMQDLRPDSGSASSGATSISASRGTFPRTENLC